MRFTGSLTSWNDERGYGFITADQGGQPLFVHIKSFPSGTGRPQVGQALNFEVVTRPDGKKQARAVQYPVPVRSRRRPREEAPAPWTLWRVMAIPAFIALVVLVARRWGVSPWLPLAYLVLSGVTLMVYAFDKSAALAGRWRVSEQSLHLLALAGGWPGALLAQQVLRHKTSKPRFLAVFWLTVVLHGLGFLAWHAGLSGLLALPFGLRS